MLVGALAAVSFAGALMLSLLVDSGQSVAVLYAVPIALVAIEFGTRAALASAALGVAMMAIEVHLLGLDVGALPFVTWAAGFFALAWLLGRYSNRLRHAFDVEQELRQSEARYRLLAENSNDLIVLVDLSGTTTYVSPACRSMLGVAPEQLIGRSVYELVHPEDRADLMKAFGTMAKLRQPVRSTCRAARTDGIEVWVEVSSRSVCDEDTGRVYGVIGVCRDVTERIGIEERLRASESVLAEAQGLAHIGSWQWDIEDDQVHWSDELYRIFGLNPDDPPGSYDRYLRRVHEDDRDLVARTVTKALADLQPFDLYHRAARADGSVRVVHGLGRVLADRDGRPTRLVGTAQDVTEQMLAEQATQESEARYRLLAENSTDMIAVADVEGVLRYLSPSCRRVLGHEPEDLIGRPVVELVNRADAVHVAQAYADLLDHPAAKTAPPFRVPRQDGDEVWLECSVRPIQGEDGRVVQVQAAARDVTPRVKAERALEQVHAQLERDAWELGRSNAELEQFAYDVSHDLGEPLGIMSQSARHLSTKLGDRLDDDGHKLLVTIVDGLDRTQTLISDLLRYSLVAREPVEPGAVDCEMVISEALEILEDSIAEKDATVSWGELPVVTGHRPQLGQVFQNLISNALKFVREGEQPSVRINASREADAWRFSVEDNGIGVAPAQGERVFEMFRRLHSRDAYAGTGIGLSICRRAVERHGGRIWIDASPRGGSIVSFTIPDVATANAGDQVGGESAGQLSMPLRIASATAAARSDTPSF